MAWCEVERGEGAALGCQGASEFLLLSGGLWDKGRNGMCWYRSLKMKGNPVS